MDGTYATLKPRFHIIQLTGRLVTDPAGKELPDSSYVCEMRLAVDGMGRGGRNGPVLGSVSGAAK